MKPGVTLRNAIRNGQIVAMPGIYDCWGARLVEDTGFGACSISGFGLAGSMGFPDIGLVTMTEVAHRARYIADAVNIPVVADADTGYGGALNVGRTVREFERAGVAGIHIEDQPNPKRCGALAGKQIITIREMVGRIKAALDARLDREFFIIARTDAPGISGIDDTIARCNAYADAGADVTMVIGQMKEADLARIGRDVHGLKLAVLTASSIAPAIPLAGLQAMGYHYAALPLQLAMRELWVARRMLEDLKTRGTIEHLRPEMVPFSELTRLHRLEEYWRTEQRYEA